MKKLCGILIFTLALSFSYGVNAQAVKKAGQEVKKGAKKAAHKTAEVASKSQAKIADKTYKDKVGPDGQTIYIDGHSRYYWIDKKGHRQYITEAELKDKS